MANDMAWLNSDSNRALFFSLLAPGPGERILDVGAGKGIVAQRVMIESRGGEVYAIDPDEKRVAFMKRRYPDLRSSKGTSETIPFEESFFDKVYTTMALHHFSDLGLALGEIARVLKVGGILLILDVDPSYGRGRLLNFLENVVLRKHARFVTQSELTERLEKTGNLVADQTIRRGPGYVVKCTKR